MSARRACARQFADFAKISGRRPSREFRETGATAVAKIRGEVAALKVELSKYRSQRRPAGN